MFYYRYWQEKNRCIVLEKVAENEGEDIAASEEDFELELYDVLIGYMDENKTILKYTKKLKPVETVEHLLKRAVNKTNTLEERQIEAELEMDFRLSMLELGLARKGAEQV